MNKHLFILSLSLLALYSCEKEITLDLENKSGQLVIEGNITDQDGPHLVRINRSLALTKANQSTSVANATVIISDNTGNTDTLKYTSDGLYSSQKIKAGVPGRTYTLNVFLDGKTYNSQSVLPMKVPMTGIRLSSMPFFGNTRYSVIPDYIDPISLGNFYVFKIRATNQKGLVLEVATDNFGNGAANQRNFEIPSEEDSPIKSGDTVSVEMNTIDENIYSYYTAVNQLIGRGPGGGIAPANPPNNISGGALGYFSAHTSQVLSIAIK